MSSDDFRHNAPDTEVFAVHGAEPEVQAYAMAKYSRSALSMRESLNEINEQKAEKFLNTFYFQYGHRSIADLAHIAFAIEKLSILAAIVLVDEQRWDGQERSTRYQNFRKSGYYVPAFTGDPDSELLFRDTCDFLFNEYDALSETMFQWLMSRTARPADMKVEQYERTLRARAFDYARYLLPLATYTSLGQIVNARTLETQVSRLLSSGYPEVRRLGQKLKDAAAAPAYNVNRDRWRHFIETNISDEGIAREANEFFLKDVRPAPTLVKYAEANPYRIESARELAHAAEELMQGHPIAPAPLVDLLEENDPLEVELPATLLYEHCHYSYRQLRDAVAALSAGRRNEITDLGFRHRSRHDELLRAFSAGQSFRFDILMDVGGFRDMHRHRRCIQICQPLTAAHGCDTPDEINEAGASDRYARALASATRAASKPTWKENAGAYLLPMATRCRSLFKMDFAEAVYITELRSGPAGHFSYRNVAYAMYQAVAKRYPALAQYFRVTDVREPVDLLKR